MRSYFDMADGDKGVLISSVAPQAPAHGKLQRDDVLMRFDGVQIANDGTVSFRCCRLSFCLTDSSWGLRCWLRTAFRQVRVKV